MNFENIRAEDNYPRKLCYTVGWNENMRSNFSLVSPKIVKMDTRFRAAVPVKERLTVTPLFLATGDLYARLQYLFQISKQSDCTQSVSSYG